MDSARTDPLQPETHAISVNSKPRDLKIQTKKAQDADKTKHKQQTTQCREGGKRLEMGKFLNKKNQ